MLLKSIDGAINKLVIRNKNYLKLFGSMKFMHADLAYFLFIFHGLFHCTSFNLFKLE